MSLLIIYNNNHWNGNFDFNFLASIAISITITSILFFFEHGTRVHTIWMQNGWQRSIDAAAFIVYKIFLIASESWHKHYKYVSFIFEWIIHIYSLFFTIMLLVLLLLCVHLAPFSFFYKHTPNARIARMRNENEFCSSGKKCWLLLFHFIL